jgi:hypothetical protein
LVGVAGSGVSISINNVVAVVVEDAVYAILVSSIASRGTAWAVVIKDAFNANTLGDGAGRAARSVIAVSVTVASFYWARTVIRYNTHVVGRAFGVFRGVSPLGHRAVSIICAFYTASSVNGTARSARVETVLIESTEINALERDGVAVLVDVASTRRTIVVGARYSIGEGSAILATSVVVTVDEFARNLYITVVVGTTLDASS